MFNFLSRLWFILSTSSNIGDYNRPYYRYIQLWRSPCSSFSTSDETYQLLNAPPRKLAHLVIALHIESSIRISKSNALSFFLKSNSVKSLYLDFSWCFVLSLWLCFSQRVLQNSFTDGVANPCDAESIKSYIVKNDGTLSGHPGSTYLLSQKFEFNWTVIGNMDKVNNSSLTHISHHWGLETVLFSYYLTQDAIHVSCLAPLTDITCNEPILTETLYADAICADRRDRSIAVSHSPIIF